MRTDQYLPIEDYGVIGDLYTVALVSIDGSIDFMCFPHFDSPSVFAALLDHERGGCFSLSPTIEIDRHRQFYLPDTNVLLTRFLSRDGVAELSDFMPVEPVGNAHNLVRRIKSVRGDIPCRMVCAPRFDYGRASHRVLDQGDAIVLQSKGRDRTGLRLRSSHPLKILNGTVVSEFVLRPGERAWFVLEDASENSLSEQPNFVADSFKDTVNFWRQWISRSRYRGRWRETVHRSALLLKMLTSKEHGSIVAAPTLALPEHLTGERNWDYRYTWIRDASFTIYAFIRLGLFDEATAFFQWIEKRSKEICDGDPLQTMYGLDGRKDLAEIELDHLRGYKGSSPVRIGNAAFTQLQLDIYGALVDSVYLYDKYGVPISHDLWIGLTRLVQWVCANWKRADEGVWEVRGGKHEFLYSRVMCWVAIDRAIRIARQRSLPAPLEKWRAVRDDIYTDVLDNFWDTRRSSFVQRKGASATDASCLVMPLVKFISPRDPRWVSTLRAIEEDLVEDSFVYRYRVGEGADDGFSGQEGTFSMCTFWYVECLSRLGELERARLVFEKMLGHANHLGLFAEELGPCGEHLGNSPQALTHLALISAAYDLDRRLDREQCG